MSRKSSNANPARSDQVSIKVTRAEYDRLSSLKQRTGLHPRAFFERLLDLAEENLGRLTEPRPVDSGIRAAV